MLTIKKIEHDVGIGIIRRWYVEYAGIQVGQPKGRAQDAGKSLKRFQRILAAMRWDRLSDGYQVAVNFDNCSHRYSECSTVPMDSISLEDIARVTARTLRHVDRETRN